MKTFVYLSFFLFFSLKVVGQQRPVLVVDLTNGSVDSITDISVNQLLTKDKTDFYVGLGTNGFATLDMQTPTTNVFNNTSFSMLSPTSDEYMLNEFPISTSVLFSRIEDGVDLPNCSGSMISKRHVLTAAHCVASLFPLSDSLVVDSLRVSPVFNNGESHPVFGTSLVNKVYFFRDWDLEGDDIAVLELQDPIGIQTGWISVGFNQNETELINHHYYKFSYPKDSGFGFNGDTLYTNYGSISYATGDYIGINGAQGFGGQSGSSLIHTENGVTYTSYGTATWAAQFRHAYFKNWHFYSLLEIIKDDLASSFEELNESEVHISPNPTSGPLYVVSPIPVKRGEIWSMVGELVLSFDTVEHCDISALQTGNYLGVFYLDNGRQVTKKIIKQ